MLLKEQIKLELRYFDSAFIASNNQHSTCNQYLVQDNKFAHLLIPCITDSIIKRRDSLFPHTCVDTTSLTLRGGSIKKLSSITGSTNTLKTAPLETRVSFNINMSKEGLLYCYLLALQFGLQPMIANRFIDPSVARSSIVVSTEITKIVIAFVSFTGQPSSSKKELYTKWSLMDSVKYAAFPATLYAIQNLCTQYGYKLLDSMTFNLLNQTKTISAALWLYLLLGNRQSFMQIVALGLLMTAAIVLNMDFGTNSKVDFSESYQLGIIMVAVSSMISGLATALTQKALMGYRKEQPFVFSAELAIFGCVFLFFNMLFNSNADNIDGFFSSWSLYTLIPVVTNAYGGLIVGLVTKHAGGIVKGFALIAGLLVTGVAQYFVEGKPLGLKDLAGGILVSLAIVLHSNNPPKKLDEDEKKKK